MQASAWRSMHSTIRHWYAKTRLEGVESPLSTGESKPGATRHVKFHPHPRCYEPQGINSRLEKAQSPPARTQASLARRAAGKGEPFGLVIGIGSNLSPGTSRSPRAQSAALM